MGAMEAVLWYLAAVPLFLVTLPLVLALLALRTLAVRCVTASSGRAGDEPMHYKDSVWDPLGGGEVPTIIVVALELDRLSLPAFRELVRASVVERRTADGSARAHPRFRQRVVQRGCVGALHWAELAEGELELDAHVVPAPDSARTARGALERVEGLASGRVLFPHDAPLWRFELVESFEGGLCADASEGVEGVEGAGCLVLLQLHHALTDGIGLMGLLMALVTPLVPPLPEEGAPTAIAPTAIAPRPSDSSEPAHSAIAAAAPPRVGAPPRSACAVLGAVVSTPLIGLLKLLATRDASALHPAGARMSGRKRSARSASLSLAAVKGCARGAGCTVNDVLSACAARALAARLRELGAAVPERITAHLPINSRAPGAAVRMENEFAVLILRMAPNEPRARGTLDALARSTRALKAGPEPLAMALIVRLLHALAPPPLSRPLLDFAANKATLLLSNMPGPRARVAWGGAAVRGIGFWAPTRASVGLTVASLSYAGGVRFYVNADEAVEPEPARLCALLEAACAELCAGEGV